jgi:hypothetical protein
MNDDDQKQRERAYKIWESEGRAEGKHLEHWQRAEQHHEATEEEAAAITEANEAASSKFRGEASAEGEATDIRPPSTIAPD